MKNRRFDDYGEYQVGEKYEWDSGIFQRGRKVQRKFEFMPGSRLHVLPAFKRLLHGLGRLMVVARYGLSNLDFRRPDFNLSIRLPWWKIGLAALAVFILLKKDIQFSVNMKSPVGAAILDDETDDADQNAEEFGLVQPTIFSGSSGRRGLDDGQVKDYVDRHGELAVSEMTKFGIPASVKMAQALLASRAGQHPDVQEHNNHFGEQIAGLEYKNVWENWREHSLLLFHDYPSLFDLGNDYKQWARQLERLNYSKERNYDDQLIRIIEKYKLYQLDEFRD